MRQALENVLPQAFRSLRQPATAERGLAASGVSALRWVALPLLQDLPGPSQVVGEKLGRNRHACLCDLVSGAVKFFAAQAVRLLEQAGAVRHLRHLAGKKRTSLKSLALHHLCLPAGALPIQARAYPIVRIAAMAHQRTRRLLRLNFMAKHRYLRAFPATIFAVIPKLNQEKTPTRRLGSAEYSQGLEVRSNPMAQQRLQFAAPGWTAQVTRVTRRSSAKVISPLRANACKKA